MIIDNNVEFANDRALNTGAAGVYSLGDVIDLTDLVPGSSGEDQALCLVVAAASDITAASAGTLQFQLVDGASGDISTTAPNVLARGEVHATSTTPIRAGTILFSIRLPSISQRYAGLQQITAGAAITAGSVNAFLTINPSAWIAHAAPAQL